MLVWHPQREKDGTVNVSGEVNGNLKVPEGYLKTGERTCGNYDFCLEKWSNLDAFES